jgi:UDP-N-acetylmuramoyl-L-alanyl-D-glutamate--2,6-diaminopimelate ligase
MFVAVKGTQADGHNYISKAIENGATVIVCEQLPVQIESNVTYIQLTDTEEAVGKLATTFYGDPTSKLELVGVTGTNGKTTIATLLYNMFRLFGYKAGLLSTVCNYIDGEAIPTDHTTPDPITLNQLLGRMAEMMILETIEAKGRNVIKFCEYLSGKFNRQIKTVSELTATEAAWSIKALEQIK